MNRRTVVIVVGGFSVAALVSFAVFFYTASHSRTTARQTTLVNLTTSGVKPSVVTVKIGEYVQFNSRDNAQHNLSQGRPPTEEDDRHHTAPGNLTSGLFKANEAWKVQFKKPGTYEFYDQLNPKLIATVIAYRPSK